VIIKIGELEKRTKKTLGLATEGFVKI